ncbi:MAG: hypothetical protein J0G29_06325 [Alphaproteobacteria bacterium]|nr:hypothetical protein [Alphaproteobacteria bacterium]OJV45234.1 MAG: hypothetical protein BGO28_00315 [Alphaproteobacteria bacterium 43-37]
MCDPVTAMVAMAGTSMLGTMYMASQDRGAPTFNPPSASLPAPPPAPEPPKMQDAFSGNSHLNDIKPGQLSLGIKSPLETKLDLRAKQKSALRKKQKVEGLFAGGGLNIPLPDGDA